MEEEEWEGVGWEMEDDGDGITIVKELEDFDSSI
jgi:hypothetical protein